jgi:hypothetical protein
MKEKKETKKKGKQQVSKVTAKGHNPESLIQLAD